MTRFVVVHNIPSPYRLHLFRTLSENLQMRDIAFHVHFMATDHADRPHYWKLRGNDLPFPHTFWRDVGPTIRHKAWHLNPCMITNLAKCEADYLLVGGPWDSLTGMLVSLVARRKVAIAWQESNTSTPGRIAGLIGKIKRALLSRYDFVAVPGIEGKSYLELLFAGAPHRLQCVFLPNIVDESRFSPGWMPENWSAREQMRRELGLNDQTRLALWPARLAPEKGILEFLSILEPDILFGWKILIIGQGPLKERIDMMIRSRRLGAFVQLHPYVPYEEMPSLYQASDLFLLSSIHDRNPLSVVEALHSGLPLLISRRIGNFPEAIEEGINGWSFDPRNMDEVYRNAALSFRTSQEQLIAMGKHSLCKAQAYWGSHAAVDRFLDAVLYRREQTV